MPHPTMSSLRYSVVVFVLAVLAACPVEAVAQAARTARAAAPTSSVLDDPEVRRLAKQGLDALYDMRFDAAERTFARIDRAHPEHPIGPFLQSLNTWWEILLDLQDTSRDAEFYAAMDEVVRRSDRLLRRDPDSFDAMFFKGAALGFRGRLRSNRGDWVRAAMDGKAAMDYVLGVAREAPQNDDFVFGKGIYDYFAAVIPQRYPFVRPVMAFFPDGDREAGLAALERTARHGHFIQTEAAYFLLQIHYLYERDYGRAMEYLRWLRERHPRNAFFHAIEGRIEARRGQWHRSAAVFEDILDRYRKRQPGYNAAVAEQSLYYLARSRMVHGQWRDALTALVQLEALAARREADTYFKVLGRLRQGMVYDALGQRDLAVQRYRSVLRMTDHAGAHERAERYLQRPYR